MLRKFRAERAQYNTYYRIAAPHPSAAFTQPLGCQEKGESMRRFAYLAVAAVVGLACTVPGISSARAATTGHLAFSRTIHAEDRGRTSAYHAESDVTAAPLQHADRAESDAAGITPAQIELLNLINHARADAGLQPLHLDAALDAVATERSQDMIARHYFSHEIPGVGYVFNILDREHIGYASAGENIAMNDYLTVYSLAQTVQLTNTDLMNSPEHRANLLEPSFSAVGLGLGIERGAGRLILTEVFVQP